MGNSSSNAETSNTAKEKGDAILQKIVSEVQDTMEIFKSKSGTEKLVYEKRIKELHNFKNNFVEYRKSVEESKDQTLEKMRLEILELKKSLEENKQKFDKINKDKQDLEQNLYRKSLDHEMIVRDFKEKLNKSEKILSTERDNRISVEKNIMEMKTLQMNFEVQTKKTEELQKELDNTRATLLDKIKLNMEVEAKLKLGNYSSGTESTKVLRDTIEKQNAIINQVQETLNYTQKKLDQELTNRRENLINFEIEKQLSRNLKIEKEHLIDRVKTIQADAEKERIKNKQKIEEQEKQLSEATEKLSTAHKANRQQVKLKKKAQAELSVLEEKTSIIKQLEIKLEEKERIIMEYLKQPQEAKAANELNEHQIEIGLTNFLTMSEQARVKELEQKDLEISNTKSNYESKLEDQLRRFNRIVYKLKMTEKRRDQLQQLWKNAEGKLKLLEEIHRHFKIFCEKELRGRQEFLAEFCKLKIENNEEKGIGGEASTSKETESFLSEKIVLQTQLDSKTNEIALLKQQLKQKVAEIQNIAREKQSEITKKENDIKNLKKN